MEGFQQGSSFPSPSAPPPPPSTSPTVLPPPPEVTPPTGENPPGLSYLGADVRSPSPWSSGICNCLNDFHSCCLVCWCPCVAFGRVAETVDRGSTSCGVSGALYFLIAAVTGFPCLYSCFYRSKLRAVYFLDESPCSDCCVHCWCESCALCQEYRELQNQGLDLSIGWHGNVERQRRLAAMAAAPPSVQGMAR